MKLKTKILIVVIFTLIILSSSLLYIVFEPFYFVVENVDISGNSFLTKSEIISTSTIINGESLILLSTKKTEDFINNLAWVEKVSVEKDWPNNVTVRIEERKPILALSYNGSFIIIDTNGIALDIKANFSEVNLPIINGYVPENISAGEPIMSSELWGRLSKLTNNLPIYLLVQLSEISWYSNEVTLFLNNGLEIFIGDILEFNPDKLEYLMGIIEKIEDVEKGYLDLSGIYTVFRSFN